VPAPPLAPPVPVAPAAPVVPLLPALPDDAPPLPVVPATPPFDPPLPLAPPVPSDPPPELEHDAIASEIASAENGDTPRRSWKRCGTRPRSFMPDGLYFDRKITGFGIAPQCIARASDYGPRTRGDPRR
jgi:hypothetical protein